MADFAATSPSTASDLPLFVFGSLRDMDILATVLGGEPMHVAAEPATLDGYQVRRAQGEIFPILVPAPQAVDCGDGPDGVPGLLLHGLTGDDLNRIVFYEGGGYALRPLTVRAGSPAAREARRRTRARVFLATGLLQDSGEPWSLSAWTESDKPLALMLARELMALYGVRPAAEIDGPSWEDIKTRSLAALADGGAMGARSAACL